MPLRDYLRAAAEEPRKTSDYMFPVEVSNRGKYLDQATMFM